MLRHVDELKYAYGGEAASRKLALLDALERQRLPRASAVERVHEFLCYLRAYPDSQAVLTVAETMLGRFDRRADFRRHR
jgi:hypothetical protein